MQNKYAARFDIGRVSSMHNSSKITVRRWTTKFKSSSSVIRYIMELLEAMNIGVDFIKVSFNHSSPYYRDFLFLAVALSFSFVIEEPIVTALGANPRLSCRIAPIINNLHENTIVFCGTVRLHF